MYRECPGGQTHEQGCACPSISRTSSRVCSRLFRRVDKSILVPLTSSLYVPGKLCDLENVIVDVGTGYYVQKVRLFSPSASPAHLRLTVRVGISLCVI